LANDTVNIHNHSLLGGWDDFGDCVHLPSRISHHTHKQRAKQSIRTILQAKVVKLLHCANSTGRRGTRQVGLVDAQAGKVLEMSSVLELTAVQVHTYTHEVMVSVDLRNKLTLCRHIYIYMSAYNHNCRHDVGITGEYI
jgi:hypothetical protein